MTPHSSFRSDGTKHSWYLALKDVELTDNTIITFKVPKAMGEKQTWILDAVIVEGKFDVIPRARLKAHGFWKRTLIAHNEPEDRLGNTLRVLKLNRSKYIFHLAPCPEELTGGTKLKFQLIMPKKVAKAKEPSTCHVFLEFHEKLD